MIEQVREENTAVTEAEAAKPFGLTFFEKCKEEPANNITTPNSVITACGPGTTTHRPNGPDSDFGGGFDL